MSSGLIPRVSEALPKEVWDTLEQDDSAQLIDVRTRAEWGFVGVPDLEAVNRSALCVEWSSFPDMSKNPHFVDSVQEALGGAVPSKLFFLCRSGVRSLHAAHAVAEAYAVQGITVECVNILGGFEGDLNDKRRRGQLNGWKASGLAWVQS